MPTVIEGAGAAAGLRFAIIRSRFNEDVTKRLLEGALDALRAGGARDESVDVVVVPGAFEIPLVASKLARSRRYDALICLGAVIRGETPHFDYISAEVSRGIAQASYDCGLPIIFGVLTANTDEQADARSGTREGARPGAPGAGGCDGRTNRGYEAAVSAIEMANLMKRLAKLPGPARHAARKRAP
jgi:6,7-dimethyl-8-ribityllumazine synthase